MAYADWRERFAEAMDPRLYRIEHLDAMCADGGVFIWESDNAAILAEVKTYPTGARVVHGIVAAGDLDEITKLIARAEVWGKLNGCVGAVIESREGWAKALKSSGYSVFQTSIWKDL